MGRTLIAGRRIIPRPAACWCGAAVCDTHADRCAACGRVMRRAMLRWVTVACSAEHGPLRRLICIDADRCAD